MWRARVAHGAGSARRARGARCPVRPEEEMAVFVAALLETAVCGIGRADPWEHVW
jgi:hypothetical protein